MKKSNHSKKIVKQLKKEYKEDLEKTGHIKQENSSGAMASSLDSITLIHSHSTSQLT